MSISTPTNFLSASERRTLKQITRRRKVEVLTWKRARALLLLDVGTDARVICEVLEIGPTTLPCWRASYREKGASFAALNDYSPRSGHLTGPQESALTATLRAQHFRNTDEIRAHIRDAFGQEYSRPGCIKLMHRLGFCYKKPKQLPIRADPEKQAAFIENYQSLQRHLSENEAIYFVDAVHPDHQVRPAYGWFHQGDKPVVPSNSGRRRMNIHGAVNLENFDLPYVDALTIDAKSTIALFAKLEARNRDKATIHVILDNARYHHAKLVQSWLARPDCRIKLHWLPPYAPHLNAIERLWGVLHKCVTHNRFYQTYNEFCAAIVEFLTKTVPKDWRGFRDTVTDNFRVISTSGRKICT